MNEESIELLVCASFFGNFGGRAVGSGGGRNRDDVPNSGMRGFMGFLRFLSEWDWTSGLDVSIYAIAKDSTPADPDITIMSDPNEPLLESTEAGDLVSIGTSYQIRTSLDPLGVVFTSPASHVPGPNPVLARRIREVAKGAWGHLKKSGVGSDHFVSFILASQ